MNRKYIARKLACIPGVAGGFSLVELLAVIAIMVTLLSVVGGSLAKSGSKAGDAGERLASSISLAGSYAKSRNRLVWLWIAPHETMPGDLELRFFYSVDGTNAAASVKAFRRPVVIGHVVVKDDLPDFGERVKVDRDQRMKHEGFIVIKPTGEVYVFSGEEKFPMPDGSLRSVSEIGLQAVRGKTLRPIKQDTAVVQMRGLSGNALIYQP